MPVLMITLPLMMLPMMPATELDLGMSLIPVTGVMLLLQALIEGQYWEVVRFVLPVMGVTSLCCLLAMRWAIDQFNKESVLFRESEQWGLGIWLRHLVRDRRDTPSLAAAVLCGVLLLLIRFFASFLFRTPATWDRFATTTVISLVAFIATPAIAMSMLLARSPMKTLLLGSARFDAAAMAALLALALHPANVAMGVLVQKVYPYSADILEQLQAFRSVINGAPKSMGCAPSACGHAGSVRGACFSRIHSVRSAAYGTQMGCDSCDECFLWGGPHDLATIADGVCCWYGAWLFGSSNGQPLAKCHLSSDSQFFVDGVGDRCTKVARVVSGT